MREDQQELKTREQKKKAKDAKRIRWNVHKTVKNKGTSHVQDEMEKLMHHDEQNCSSCGKGRDDNKDGWLDPELCAKARREGVEYIRRHKMHTRVFGEACLRETGKAPIKTSWTAREAQRAREVSREGIQDAREGSEARVVRVDAAAGVAEISTVGGRHG